MVKKKNMSDMEYILKKKNYHKNYYRKNRKYLLQRQKKYEKKKLDNLKPLRKQFNKGIIRRNKGYSGFERQKGTFIVTFD
jgi:hypothetical protein